MKNHKFADKQKRSREKTISFTKNNKEKEPNLTKTNK